MLFLPHKPCRVTQKFELIALEVVFPRSPESPLLKKKGVMVQTNNDSDSKYIYLFKASYNFLTFFQSRI